MSTYYYYYIGYKKDNIVYPFGPFDCNGKIKPIICYSRSFSSSLKDEFLDLRDACFSNELKDALGIKNEEDMQYSFVKYLPINNLPSDDYVKYGYYLIEDVDKYLSSDFYERNELIRYEIFFDRLSPVAYAERLKNEAVSNTSVYTNDKDDDDECEEKHPTSDYMFFQYPDYTCKEFDSFIIRKAYEGLFDEFSDKDIKPEDMVVFVDIC